MGISLYQTRSDSKTSNKPSHFEVLPKPFTRRVKASFYKVLLVVTGAKRTF